MISKTLRLHTLQMKQANIKKQTYFKVGLQPRMFLRCLSRIRRKVDQLYDASSRSSVGIVQTFSVPLGFQRVMIERMELAVIRAMSDTNMVGLAASEIFNTLEQESAIEHSKEIQEMERKKKEKP